jgi:hypothetical protein
MAQIRVKVQGTNKIFHGAQGNNDIFNRWCFFYNAVLSGGFSDDLHELHPTFRGKQGVMPQE